MPKIKVNNQPIEMKLCISHYSYKSIPDANLRLIALLVLEIWRTKISLRRREQVIKFGYLPPENGFNFKKMSFHVQNRSFRPKIDPPCQFQQFSSRGNFFIFTIFGTSQ